MRRSFPTHHIDSTRIPLQVVQGLAEGRGAAGAPASPLRDVRLGSAVRAVRLLPGGAGVEVEVAGQVGG